MTEWIISANPKNTYDAPNAFRELKKVDWKQQANMESGDVVYVYISANIQQLMFKCKVNQVDLEKQEIDDHKFYLSDELTQYSGKYVELEMTKEFNTDLFHLSELEKHGFSAPQRPSKVTQQVKEYIDLVQTILNSEEMDPDRHDGCYEFLREIVKSYAALDDYSRIDYRDLNLLYFSCVGSWAYGFDKKQRTIEESHLPLEEKNRLTAVLNAIRTKAQNGEYENNEDGKGSIGMFGSGFKSFLGKTDEESSQKFIRMCVELLPLEDDNTLYSEAEKVVNSAFNGMRAASASVILHTLKPFAFPILNGNVSKGNAFQFLGVELIRPQEIGTYIENCRLIKKFRDSNFKVKNYRIYDRAMWYLGNDSVESSDEVESDTFWPSYDIYPINLTKDDWKRFISEVEYAHKGCMRVLKCYLDIGGTASPKRMSAVYKGHFMVYTSSVSQISQRALRFFNLKPCYAKEDKQVYYFPIAFQGKLGKDKQDNGYMYRMRPELMEALREFDLSDIDLEYKNEKEDDEMNEIEKDQPEQFDKNMILYGPPGTGKTYYTAIYSVAICDNRSLDSVRDSGIAEIMKRFNELKAERRVEFTTFHQSYGYEEFIEGIKPVLSSDATEETKKDVRYDYVDGIFKAFCKRASEVKRIQADGVSFEKADPRVWCLMLDRTGQSKLKKYCFDNNEIRIGWPELPERITSETEVSTEFSRSMLTYFQDDMEIGDIIVIQKKFDRIDAIGIVAGDYEYDRVPFDGTWPRKRKVTWLATDIDVDLFELNGGKHLGRPSIYPLDRVKAKDIIQLANSAVGKKVVSEQETRPFVFIIDEINRGNISKIFGELITLIEDTKRAGKDEAASAKLPYSGEDFSVPDNIYIIGTMNTADRSIALMDTALRRRFQFKEMMPDVAILRANHADKVGDIDVAAILEKINERITFLYDREHTIGHSFFMKLKDEPTIEKLADIFSKAVIPLLQEYFYEDYQKIQFVLGDNAKSKDEYKFILDEKIIAKDVFKGNVAEYVELPPKKFKINEAAFNEPQSYLEII